MRASFWDILEEKIRKDALSPRKKPSSSTAFLDHELPGLAWLMGQDLGVSPRREDLARRKYGVVARPPRPRPNHLMNPAQRLAFTNLTKFCSSLPENFTEAELKRAWKEAARKTHPDLGGSAEQFQAVKASVEILTELL